LCVCGGFGVNSDRRAKRWGHTRWFFRNPVSAFFHKNSSYQRAYSKRCGNKKKMINLMMAETISRGKIFR
jgi:hypothetical protein